MNDGNYTVNMNNKNRLYRMHTKQKILFVMNNMHVGGSEKALVSLLNELDYSKYEVDLQLFKQEGLFLGEIPEEVNLLDVPKNYHYFDSSYKKVLKTLNPNLIVNRYRFKKAMQIAKSPAEAEQLAWKFLSCAIEPLDKEYDVAVGYLEKTPIYFVVDKVRAKTKIGFIHNDYTNIKVNPELDTPFFEKLDYLCSVSDHCVEILKNTFPVFAEKIKLIPNLFSEKLILRKAREAVTEVEMSGDFIQIVSIGRLAEQKGFDLAIEAANVLKQRGFKFKWFILGEGSLRTQLEKQIEDLNLQEQFTLLGNHTNPYKFLQKADWVVQTSRFEGKSIAIDEAKLLNKIVLVTDYPTVRDQLTDGIDGFICGFSAREIADRIISVTNDTKLKENITRYLENHRQEKENKLLELL